MIRRNIPLIDLPDKWLLLSQVEHARVSFELAEAWGGSLDSVVCGPNDQNPHLQEVRQELLSAILHHDDGWASWEASPPLDSEHGRPWSFMEIHRSQALPLWRDSVLRAYRLGPLAGWVVAGHFAHLLRESHEAHCELSEQWLAEVDVWRDEWLAEWRSLNRPVHTADLAEECLEWLRLFDWLSLWLCCYCPASLGDQRCDAMKLDTGNLKATPVTVTPDSEPPDQGDWRVRVEPWCFDADRLELDALGYTVPAQQYNSTGEMAKSRSPMRLRWTLMPG
ncbi:DUF3891 family protein [Aeoliella sp. ICT_H6.2]|uniref:DUF3891 family protein n=1 Tax=Aeoliella straminimaris TaxID=2954799 RepID=A0A9X2JFG0_9BACT|nr:DUF3891 family protein [Aeoliella straminimaris]MCO6043287.1 DUF3891 family protein [Aeoliella straminimaris]